MNANELKEAIVAAYLETGQDQSVTQLAARLRCSEGTIRKRLEPLPEGITIRQEARPSYVYGPTRAELRRRLLDANQRLRAEQQAVLHLAGVQLS